jgi:shikimate kinase
VKRVAQTSDIARSAASHDAGHGGPTVAVSATQVVASTRCHATESEQPALDDIEKRITAGLGRRSIVLVGLMGCGKSTVGRKLAQRLSLSFVDADEEIERAANKSIPEIFAEHGEPYFRAGEKRVIARLLRSGPQVLATGGGAFMNEETRAAIKGAGVSVWLRAELPLLMKRVTRRSNRPLLKAADPEGTMRRFIEVRYPIYALADVPVDSRDVSHDVMAEAVIRALWGSGQFGS